MPVKLETGTFEAEFDSLHLTFITYRNLLVV